MTMLPGVKTMAEKILDSMLEGAAEAQAAKDAERARYYDSTEGRLELIEEKLERILSRLDRILEKPGRGQ